MEFVWDERKARINPAKHGVAFGDAVQVFSDVHAVHQLDMKELPEGWVRIRGIPEMTDEQRERLRALAASDRPIDTSDIPELDESFWKNAKRGLPVRTKKLRPEPAE